MKFLFYSKIDPKKKGCEISKKEIKKIIKYSNIVLKIAIKSGGSSIEISKILMEKMDHFKKNLKYMEEKGKVCSRNNCKGKLLSFFKQTDQHLCVKFAKNKNLAKC